jgi:hypothetical protein
MRRMVCIRRCHGFRGGLWDKGETVDVADGEDVPRHFIPVSEYADYMAHENAPKARVDTMKAAQNTHPVPLHLQNKGGLSTIAPAPQTDAPKPGDDI